MYKLATLPFDCLLVLRENGHETHLRHSVMVEIDTGAVIHIDGRDWAVVEIHGRPDGIPAVVCRPAA